MLKHRSGAPPTLGCARGWVVWTKQLQPWKAGWCRNGSQHLRRSCSKAACSRTQGAAAACAHVCKGPCTDCTQHGMLGWVLKQLLAQLVHNWRAAPYQRQQLCKCSNTSFRHTNVPHGGHAPLQEQSNLQLVQPPSTASHPPCIHVFVLCLHDGAAAQGGRIRGSGWRTAAGRPATPRCRSPGHTHTCSSKGAAGAGGRHSRCCIS